MFFEIEMYKDFIDGLLNLLEDVENKDNVTIDLCLNLSQKIERIDTSKIDENSIISKFTNGLNLIKNLGYNVVTRIVGTDEFSN